jgi:hypothetical protein
MLVSPGFRAIYIWAPAALAIALLIALYVVASAGQLRLQAVTDAVAESRRRQQAVQEFLRFVVDAESAQRGFLLTEDSRYLQTYDPAVRGISETLDLLSASYARANFAVGVQAIRDMRVQTGIKLGEQGATLRLYGEVSRPAALALFETDYGKRSMDDLRRSADELLRAEANLFDAMNAGWRRDLWTNRILLGVGTLVNLVLIVLASKLLVRDLRRREASAIELESRNRELDALVRTRTQRLAELSSHLQTLSEKEKSSLARELHDELGGLLVATKMDVVWIRRKVAREDADLSVRWDRVLRALEEGVEFKRRIIENLRPTLLDNLGLVPALRWLISETCPRGGLTCRQHFVEPLAEMNPDANIAVFRIAQECLTNILKHAQASTVEFELRSDGENVYLTITDDGVGISPDRINVPHSHGLASMRHRVEGLGGTLHVGAAGENGCGTRIHVIVPLERAAARTREAEAAP